MTAEPGDSMHPPLPVAVFAQPSLKGIYLASLAIAAGASLVSLWGLGAGSIYPSQELREAFVPNDAATLLVGVPLMLGDLVVVLATGLACFVPTGLFIRGVVRESTRGSS